jgi:hypothetical protein
MSDETACTAKDNHPHDQRPGRSYHFPPNENSGRAEPSRAPRELEKTLQCVESDFAVRRAFERQMRVSRRSRKSLSQTSSRRYASDSELGE